jgi:hypothetical protein
MLGVIGSGCGSPRMDFGRKKVRRRADSTVSQADYELNLQLLGGRKHRLAHRVKGRDVRRLLPQTPLKLVRGAWVFAVLPVGRTWRRVCWRSARVTAITKTGATLITEEQRTFDSVPPAMIVPQRRGPVKAGQVVRVHSGRQLPFGRVATVRPGTVEVITPWLGRPRKVSVRRREVLPIREGLFPAAPVIYRLASTQRMGTLLTLERKYRWVLGAEGVVHRLSWDRVKPVPITRRYNPGDRVRAALPVGLKLASVTRALGQHILYEIAWSQTRRSLVSFSQLAPP